MAVSNVGSLFDQSAAFGPSQDAEHERCLFQLMGQLEQILVRLDTLNGSKRFSGSVEIAKEILVELVEFSESQFPKDQSKVLIDQVCDFHESTKRFERMLGGQSWSGFAALIGIKPSYSAEVKAMFQQLGLDLIEVVGESFRLFESRFESTEQVSEWQASSQVFVDDLIRRWKTENRA